MESTSELNSASNSKNMGEAVNYKNSSKGIISSSGRHRSKEMENLSFEISKYPRDLLQTFLGSTNHTSTRIRSDDPKLEEDDDEGLNLGLGLSLGGKFGVDKSKNMGLMRSSSIAGNMPLFKDDDMGVAPPPTPGSNLVRTASLPVETEEEWRKRKEMQTLRRMEAKRRRSEKQRVLKETGGGGEDKGGVEGLKLRARLEREQQCLGITNKLIGSSMGDLLGPSKPPTPSSSTHTLEVKRRRTTFGSLQGFLIAEAHDQAQAQAQAQAEAQAQAISRAQPQPQPLLLPQPQPEPEPEPQPLPLPQQGSSQGSGESQGGTSSDASELESKIHQGSIGSSSCGEARSPASIHSQQDRGSQESIVPSGNTDDQVRRVCGPEEEILSKQTESADNKRKETAGSSGIEDMPCVFTIGDGPNGRKVEGILYKYGKGEEVRIMCVCHGSFFSPPEFVKHAGGRDVDHPLRHIVVSPSTSAFQ